MSTRSVSVVIPNYNGKGLLESNLPSVFSALKKASLDSEVIVADDASHDDSVAFLQSHYPQIKVLQSEKNLGFSGNINRGLRAATKDLVLALNSDVSLSGDYFLAQMKYFDNPSTFGVMGAIHNFGSAEPIHLDMYPSQSLTGIIKSIQLEGYDFKKPIPIYFVSGSNALIDRKKLAEIDYFNYLFSPFYGEDADLGMRARRKGWESYYESSSICFHTSATTIKKYNSQKKIRTISRRNKITFHDLHLEGGRRFSFFAKLSLDFVSRFLIGDFGFYRAFFDYWSLRAEIKRQRAQNHYLLSSSQVIKDVQKKMKDALLLHR